VASQNYLGIYIGRGTATVVCLDSQGKSGKILGCFSVSVEEQEGPDGGGMLALANLIAQGCAARELGFSEAAVALDCAMFMQHSLHSEFNDLKQIAATVRFDTEEALSTDITDVAMAFEITSSDQAGSDLTVFTAQRKILSDVLLSLQQHNLDPVTIQPDVNCLSRFICQKVSSVESQQGRTLFGMLSRRGGYLIVPPVLPGAGSQKASRVRTFLVGPTQDRGELLAREVLITTALVENGEPINFLKVFDSAGAVNCEQLGERLGIETSGVDWLQSIVADPQALADCADPVDFAIAYGAALTHFEKGQGVNFRDDFSPFQGKKIRMQKTLKFTAISITILLMAVGLYFQSQLLKRNKYRSSLRAKFAKNYSVVMLGQRPPAKTSPVRKLESELRRIRDAKKGLITVKGEKSISSKLTLVLEAFNKCAAQTDLQIDKISITAKNIRIEGDTSSRNNTLRLRKAIEESKLEISQENSRSKGGRDYFSMTVVPQT